MKDNANKLLRIASTLLRGDFTDDFDTSDTLGPDNDETLDENEEALFWEDKQDIPLSSPARMRHDIPDALRSKPELIDTIKKG